MRACTFELTGSEFLDVAIAGSFNDWRPRAMKRTQEGLWKVTLRLPPGTYEYKFIADGKWLEDPKNPKRVANPYFTQNSVQTVS
ncbi:MAG: hypothetical protein A2Z27_01665 [candidate division Zixibacteria bacterium RBG_16_50_21]|nr:MAG: hypothetical protein A2Z27_01665 [candidate division Zixibacteria bacterium RBG_16_50_21]